MGDRGIMTLSSISRLGNTLQGQRKGEQFGGYPWGSSVVDKSYLNEVMMEHSSDAGNAPIRSPCLSYVSKNFNRGNPVLNSVWNGGGVRRSQWAKSRYEQLWGKEISCDAICHGQLYQRRMARAYKINNKGSPPGSSARRPRIKESTANLGRC